MNVGRERLAELSPHKAKTDRNIYGAGLLPEGSPLSAGRKKGGANAYASFNRKFQLILSLLLA